MDQPHLVGRRVFLLEDEFLIAVEMGDVLADWGLVVVGPISRVADALVIAATEEIDLALLDINVFGDFSYPVAELLEERGIPFVFLSGYGDGFIPQRPGWDLISKPVSTEELFKTVTRKLVSRNSSDA